MDKPKAFIYITDNDARNGFNVYVLDDETIIKDLCQTDFESIEATKTYIADIE